MASQTEFKNPILVKYFFGERADAWIMQYYVQWPSGFSDYKQVSASQMRQIAIDHLASPSYGSRGDEEYVEIVRADNSFIIYQFNVQKWVNDSLSSAPKYRPPTSVSFNFKKPIPRFIYAHAGLHDLADFVTKHFKEHLSRNERAFFGDYSLIAEALKATAPMETVKLFTSIFGSIVEYQLDWRACQIKVSVRPWVLIALMAVAARVGAKEDTSAQNGSQSQPHPTDRVVPPPTARSGERISSSEIETEVRPAMPSDLAMSLSSFREEGKDFVIRFKFSCSGSPHLSDAQAMTAMEEFLDDSYCSGDFEVVGGEKEITLHYKMDNLTANLRYDPDYSTSTYLTLRLYEFYKIPKIISQNSMSSIFYQFASRAVASFYNEGKCHIGDYSLSNKVTQCVFDPDTGHFRLEVEHSLAASLVVCKPSAEALNLVMWDLNRNNFAASASPREYDDDNQYSYEFKVEKSGQIRFGCEGVARHACDILNRDRLKYFPEIRFIYSRNIVSFVRNVAVFSSEVVRDGGGDVPEEEVEERLETVAPERPIVMARADVPSEKEGLLPSTASRRPARIKSASRKAAKAISEVDPRITDLQSGRRATAISESDLFANVVIIREEAFQMEEIDPTEIVAVEDSK